MEVKIEARGLTKNFGSFRAVDELSFDVKAGEVFGLLGPNGAGKTTTLRMLSGLLSPSSGEAFIAGHSMQGQQQKARTALGFLTGDMDLYRRLKPDRTAHLFRPIVRSTQTHTPRTSRQIGRCFWYYGF